jgi:hypothetical protein
MNKNKNTKPTADLDPLSAPYAPRGKEQKQKRESKKLSIK